MMYRSEENQRTSVVLTNFTNTVPKERITLGEIKDVLADRVFGILMLIFAVPNLVPFPIPGISVFFGVPLMFLAGQMVLGREKVWFPQWLSKRSFPHRDFNKILFYVIPYLMRLEKILKPRITYLLHPIPERILAVVCLLMAVLITLPIPLGNWMPAFAITLCALAMLEHDGVFAILGVIVSCVSFVFVSSLVFTIIGGVWLFIQNFFM